MKAMPYTNISTRQDSVICEKTLARVVPYSLSVNGTYLLYGYVHLIKNIRVLWITEETCELKFQYENKFLVAKWHHLRNLFQYVVGAVLKMPKLSETAVNPKSIERQRVSTCLQFFFFFFFFFFCV